MSQEQLDQLDSVITPEVVNTIVMLLPELVALINAIDNDQKPYPDKEFGKPQKADRTPPKAIPWWQQNNWFNAAGYERETAAARAIDVQLDLEGYDKNSDEYYDLLSQRLSKLFPTLGNIH